MKAKKSLQKLTESETKINRILSLEQVMPLDLEQLSESEKDRLMEILTVQFNKLKGIERDRFYAKFEAITPNTTKNQLWEANHILITRAISHLMQQNGRMPTTTEIANETELSRQTVHRHFKEYASHPEYLEQIEQFRFMTSKVLASVFRYAVNGDTAAAKLYFNIMGFMNGGQSPSNTLIQTQNNFIQINGTVISQEAVRHLNPEQLSTIEGILKTALPQPEFQLGANEQNGKILGR